MTSEKLGPSFFEVFKISETTIFVRECLRLIRTLDSQHFRSIAVKKVFRPHPTTEYVSIDYRVDDQSWLQDLGHFGKILPPRCFGMRNVSKHFYSCARIKLENILVLKMIKFIV